jgi:hypothetical protein
MEKFLQKLNVNLHYLLASSCTHRLVSGKVDGLETESGLGRNVP